MSQNVSVTTEEKEIELKPETKKNAFSWIFNIIKKEKGKKINIVTLSDEAGHKTEVTFEKKQDNGHFISISLQSILYDRAKTEFSKSLLQYKWFLDWKRSKYVLFGSHIVNDDNLLESHYVSKNNETWIMSKPQELDDDNNDDDVERRPAWKKVPGMVIPYLQTEQGELKMEY